MDIFRLDLQVHFFWGFFVTMAGGIYWTPLFYAGMVVTVIKEGLDLWSKGVTGAWRFLVGSGRFLPGLAVVRAQPSSG